MLAIRICSRPIRGTICLIVLIGTLTLAACSVGPDPGDTVTNAAQGVASPSPAPSASALFLPQVQDSAETPVPEKTTVPPAPTAVSPVLGYTHYGADGNRYARGRGALPAAPSIDVPLEGVPRWVVAVPDGSGSIWAVVLEDGAVKAFRHNGTQLQEIEISPASLPPGMPPLLTLRGARPSLVTAPTEEASTLTHPVVLPRSGRLAFVAANGDLVLWDDGEVARLALKALPDARLLVDENDRVLLLTDATRRYAHGVLGDRIEAGSISLVETVPKMKVVLTIAIPEPSVVEGIAPIWADLTGDGRREIIVTLSDEEQGARVVAFAATGALLAEGPAIGSGFRWRHQLAVGPFGPEGEVELVDVRTPHIGGIVELYRLRGAALEIVAKAGEYTSHVLGSRNLDMGSAGDFDGDGHPEVLVLSLARTELVAIRHTAQGAEVAWSVPTGGKVSTNLAAVTVDDGHLMVGVGREDDGEGGTLRVWAPPPSSEESDEGCLCRPSSIYE